MATFLIQGKELYTTIVRDGKEVAYLANNKYYNFNYQYYNFLTTPVTLKMVILLMLL
jgi:hypothetical protein